MTNHNKHSLPTSPESSVDDPGITIAAQKDDSLTTLINSNPLYETNLQDTSTNENQQRPRRRSSVSIIQALVNTSHLLSTNDARRR